MRYFDDADIYDLSRTFIIRKISLIIQEQNNVELYKDDD